MNEKTVVSLFSGCGGMDLGFEGGFNVLNPCVNIAATPDILPVKDIHGWVRLKETSLRTVFSL